MVKWSEIVGNEPLHEDAGVRPNLQELSLVSLAHDVTVSTRVLPMGSTGTVVGAYSDGDGYEVEFQVPFHAVVTLARAEMLVK